MGACLEPDKMMIVTELVPRGDLADMLADTSIHLSMPTRIKMARGAALGMNWYALPVYIPHNGRLPSTDHGIVTRQVASF